MFGFSKCLRQHTVLYKPVNDITEPIELWLFLRRHSFQYAGINEQTDLLNNIRLYPNPAANNLTISSSSTSHHIDIEIEGQLLKTFIASDNKTNIDISAMPCGVYLVQVKTEKGVAVKKFIKE